MTLRPEDEHPHEAPPGAPAPSEGGGGWQENWFLLGWDPDARAGFSVHLERFPVRGETELKAVVAVGDALAGSTTTHAPGPDVSVGPLRWEVDVPFRSLRVSLEGHGRAGTDEHGFVGHTGAEVPIALDLELRSPLGPVDHAAALARLALPGTERDHYEAVGEFVGSVRVGDVTVDAAGGFVRDHTWGVRGYTAFDAAWWYPTCLDGGRCYFGGASVRYGDDWHGYAIYADERGLDVTTDVVVHAAGEPGIASFRATTLVARFPERGELAVESEASIHLAHSFPGFAPGYFTNDALGEASLGGLRGFGVREWNGYLPGGSTVGERAR